MGIQLVAQSTAKETTLKTGYVFRTKNFQLTAIVTSPLRVECFEMASNLFPPCKCHLQPLTLRCGGVSTKNFLRDLLLKAHVPEASGKACVTYLGRCEHPAFFLSPRALSGCAANWQWGLSHIEVEGILRFLSEYLTLQRRWQCHLSSSIQL